MTTGARRGELCALRWKHLNVGAGVLEVERAIAQIGDRVYEKDTMTHQKRRLSLDPETIELLRALRVRAVADADQPRGRGRDPHRVRPRP